MNVWSNEQKAQYLAVSLVGPARELLQGVSLKSTIACSMLLRRLRERYGPGEHSNVHRSTLVHENKKKEKDQEN